MWDLMGLLVGVGLIFTSDYRTWTGRAFKVLGVVMIIVSTTRLIGGFVQ